jgi:D-amino peptidase
MEGISGIVDWDQVTPGSNEWMRGRKLMTGDANAAINGAYEAGVEAVTVSDSHWHMRSIEIEELDPRARLHSGSPSPFSMMQGIDDHPPYDAVACVGYHARAGAKKGVLCHTWSDKIHGVWLNEVEVGEIGLNAAVAGHFGIPIVAISGDHTACLEAQTLLGMEIEVAVVKLGTGRYSAECLPLTESREKICEAVARGVTKLKSGAGAAKPFTVTRPVELAVEFKFPHQADAAFLVPGARRPSGTRIEFTGEDMVMAIRAFRAMATLVGPNS